MSKLVFATFLVSLVVASTPWPLREQQFEYNKQAELDAKGNIYVSSDQGRLIWMADTKHCSEVHVANDQQTVGCRVMQDQKLGNSAPSLQLEIYQKGGHKEIIEPGAPILDWHFWEDGQQVAFSYGQGNGQVTYALYDLATARIYRKTGRTVRREIASSMGEEPSADSRRVRSDERRPYRRANKMDRESSSSNWQD